MRSKEIHAKRAAAVRDVHQFRFSAGDSSRTSPLSVPRRAERFREDSPKPIMVLKVVSNRIDDPFQTEIEVLVVGPVGFEPTTFGLKVRCSAELSYRPAHSNDSNAARRCHSSNSSPSSANADAVVPDQLSAPPSFATVARNLIPSAFSTRSTVENSGFPSGDSDL